MDLSGVYLTLIVLKLSRFIFIGMVVTKKSGAMLPN